MARSAKYVAAFTLTPSWFVLKPHSKLGTFAREKVSRQLVSTTAPAPT